MNKPLIFGIFFIFFIKGLILANPKKDTYINTSNITYNEEANIVELAESTKINIENTNIQIEPHSQKKSNHKKKRKLQFFKY